MSTTRTPEQQAAYDRIMGTSATVAQQQRTAAPVLDMTGKPYDGSLGAILGSIDIATLVAEYNRMVESVPGTLWERASQPACVECGTRKDVWIELCPACRERIAEECDTFPMGSTPASVCTHWECALLDATCSFA